MSETAPPAPNGAEFPDKVLWLIVTGPNVSMAPPNPPAYGPLELSHRALQLTVSIPSFSMAPPRRTGIFSNARLLNQFAIPTADGVPFQTGATPFAVNGGATDRLYFQSTNDLLWAARWVGSFLPTGNKLQSVRVAASRATRPNPARWLRLAFSCISRELTTSSGRSCTTASFKNRSAIIRRPAVHLSFRDELRGRQGASVRQQKAIVDAVDRFAARQYEIGPTKTTLQNAHGDAGLSSRNSRCARR